MFRRGKVPTPLYFRTRDDHCIGWEIYAWNHFFITVGLVNFEFQFNKWPNPHKNRKLR